MIGIINLATIIVSGNVAKVPQRNFVISPNKTALNLHKHTKKHLMLIHNMSTPAYFVFMIAFIMVIVSIVNHLSRNKK